MSSLRRFVHECLHLNRWVIPVQIRVIPGLEPQISRAFGAVPPIRPFDPGRIGARGLDGSSAQPYQTSTKLSAAQVLRPFGRNMQRPATDRGQITCPRPHPLPSLATTDVSCSQAPRRLYTWVCRWRRSGAGLTPATSAATARPAVSGASHAPSSTSSSPRCRTTDRLSRRSPPPRRLSALRLRAAELSLRGGRTSRAGGGRRTSPEAGRACRRL